MPRLLTKSLITATALGLMASAGIAGEFDNQIAARQAQMKLYAFNIGQLGAMAKGEMAYDAAAASAAAANLVTLTSLDDSKMWPPGSDSGADKASRAKAEIWSNFPDVMAKSQALKDAAAAMSAAAGTDLDGLRGAMGALGGACQGCHKPYREPQS